MIADYEGIEGVAYRLRVTKADNLALEMGSDTLAESLVHEVAHAISLGVPVERGVTYMIHAALRPLGHTALVYNEGLTLASEQHTLRGQPTGCFQRCLWLALGLDLGQRVMRFIGRRLGRGRSLRHL